MMILDTYYILQKNNFVMLYMPLQIYYYHYYYFTALPLVINCSL